MKHNEAVTWIASALEDYLRTLPLSAREPTAHHARFAMQIVMDEAKRAAPDELDKKVGWTD